MLEKQEEKTVKKLKGKSQKESEFLLNRLKEIQKQTEKEEKLKKQEKKIWRQKWEEGLSKK